jgi:hypothetical protein
VYSLIKFTEALFIRRSIRRENNKQNTPQTPHPSPPLLIQIMIDKDTQEAQQKQVTEEMRKNAVVREMSDAVR